MFEKLRGEKVNGFHWMHKTNWMWNGFSGVTRALLYVILVSNTFVHRQRESLLWWFWDILVYVHLRIISPLPSLWFLSLFVLIYLSFSIFIKVLCSYLPRPYWRIGLLKLLADTGYLYVSIHPIYRMFSDMRWSQNSPSLSLSLSLSLSQTLCWQSQGCSVVNWSLRFIPYFYINTASNLRRVIGGRGESGRTHVHLQKCELKTLLIQG